MCTNTECGRPSFDPLSEAYSLERILNVTGSFSNVADRVAREALTWYAEWGQSKPDPVIFFRYEKGPNGWVANGQLMRDLFHPNSIGGDRKDRFVRAEAGILPGGQAVVISEDLGEGWNKGYIYVYTDRGDHIEGVAIEYRGSEESLMRVKSALSERSLHKGADKTDFHQPLFFQEHIQPSDVFSAVERSYGVTEHATQKPYLARLHDAVENYPLLQTRYERNVTELAERAQEQFLQSDVGMKLYSDVAQTLVRSLERDEHVSAGRAVQDLVARDGSELPIPKNDNEVLPLAKEVLTNTETMNDVDREKDARSMAPIASLRGETSHTVHHESLTDATRTVVQSAHVIAKDSIAADVVAGEFVFKKLRERRKRTQETPEAQEREFDETIESDRVDLRLEERLETVQRTHEEMSGARGIIILAFQDEEIQNALVPAIFVALDEPAHPETFLRENFQDGAVNQSIDLQGGEEQLVLDTKTQETVVAFLVSEETRGLEETPFITLESIQVKQETRQVSRLEYVDLAVLSWVKEFIQLIHVEPTEQAIEAIEHEEEVTLMQISELWGVLLQLYKGRGVQPEAERQSVEKFVSTNEDKVFDGTKRLLLSTGPAAGWSGWQESALKEAVEWVQKEEREHVEDFSFAFAIWFLLKLDNYYRSLRSLNVFLKKESKEGSVIDKLKKRMPEGLVQREPSQWILLSIIWHLAAIREMGLHNNPIMQLSNTTNNQMKKRKNGNLLRRGIVFAFVH